MKPDEAHIWTDAELEKLERRIDAEYKKAAGELQDKIEAYFERFKKRDAEQRKRLEKGEITRQEYVLWRKAQMGRGKRFEALRERIAQRMTKANEVAAAYINDSTPGIYSLNRNYGAYTIEKQAGEDVGFDLWDEQTVKRLLVERPDLMPYYPPQRAVKRDIDLAWGKRQITAQLASGILQGESVKRLADRLQANIPNMNRTSAIRAARTAVTGAQNAGRMDSYRAAEEMGIRLQKRWLSTLDNRTRHAHQLLDGQTQERDQPFHSELGDIMYPGDPSANPANVYNCRCTLIADVEGAGTSAAQRRARDPETGESVVIEDMTYAQWAQWKEPAKRVANPAGSGIIEAAPPVVFRRFETGDAVNGFFYYDGDERGAWLKQRSQYGQWKNGLAPDEREKILDYTAGEYKNINNFLRQRGMWEGIEKEKVKDAIKHLDSAISRYQLKDSITVQRGVMEDALDGLISQYGNNHLNFIGQTFHDDGYVSTTALCGNPVATRKPVLFEIDIPAGVGRGAYVNEFSEFTDAEYEFLLRRGADYTIVNVVLENDTGKIFIKMVMNDA